MRTLRIRLNYRCLVRPDWLAPFSREAESNPHEAKADNHVPSADTWDWIFLLRHIEDDDPEETDQEIGHHYRGQPAWALEWAAWLSIVN